MFSRRFFLMGAGSMALAQGLSGCGSPQAALKVLLLKGSIPPQLIGSFKDKTSSEETISFSPEAQLQDILNLLESRQKKEKSSQGLLTRIPFINREKTIDVDLATLGDYWLENAIQKRWIQPLNLENLTGWQQLQTRWQNLVKRTEEGKISENGQIWGAPYRWGTTLIAYRSDKFKKLGWSPTDWTDLWREELRDRITLLDQPREIIGLTLKKLGYSYNSEDLGKIPNLKAELLNLQKQTKFYSSDRYLEPLIMGDSWLAVGWSSDVLSITSRYQNIKAVIPQSGTSLWADIWVQPNLENKSSDRNSQLQKWIDFCWQPESAKQISLFTNGASPSIFSLKAEQLPQDIRDNPLSFIKPQILDKCEFLYPLSPEASKQYKELWKQVREATDKGDN
jgi:putative spermidine/putrescine transport system substrate-binding protein